MIYFILVFPCINKNPDNNVLIYLIIIINLRNHCSIKYIRMSHKHSFQLRRSHLINKLIN